MRESSVWDSIQLFLSSSTGVKISQKHPPVPGFGVPTEVNAVVDAVESDGEPALRLRIV